MMGLLVSVLFSYVGAVEVVFIIRDIVHQVGLHNDQMKVTRSSRSRSSSSEPLAKLQENLRKSLKSAQEHLCESDTVQSMADGVQYDQGYRILSAAEEDVSRRWLESRACVAEKQTHNANEAINSFEKDVNVTKFSAESNRSDDLPSEDDSLRSSSSLSVVTVTENKSFKSNENDENQTSFDESNRLSDFHSESPVGDVPAEEQNDVVPDIHFDEYSQAYLHALDGVKSNSPRRADELTRRKRFKHQNSGHSGDFLSRRRSEDIDGETDNPWGELNPDDFHDDELWRRERAMSIQENDDAVEHELSPPYRDENPTAIKENVRDSISMKIHISLTILMCTFFSDFRCKQLQHLD